MLPFSSKFSKIILTFFLATQLIFAIGVVFAADAPAEKTPEEELKSRQAPTKEQAAKNPASKEFFLIPTGLIEGCDFKYGQMNMNCIPNYIKYLITIIVEIVGSVCVVMIMVGGVQYIFTGIAEKKEGGKETIKYAIYGLIISILAWVIVTTLISIITL